MVLKQTKAWRIFSEWIRARDRGQCYTCTKRADPKEMDAGHRFHSCSYHFFDPLFVRCQCTKCNRWLSGNLGIYQTKLIKELGMEVMDQAEKDKVKYKRWKPAELKEIELKYGDN